MDHLSDYELDRTDSDAIAPAQPTERSFVVWVVVLSLAGLAAAYVAFAWRPRPASAPVASAPPHAADERPLSLGGQPDAVTLPPLDASDALVRTLVRALSDNPAVASWLATEGLVRNFTVVTANIADGATPAKQLTPLHLSTAFRVVERDGGTFVDPRGYERYAPIANAVAGLDASRVASVYATLKPRIEEAYRDLGSPEPSFDVTLERAIVLLLKTPIAPDGARLKPKGIGYAYVDERLESLTGAQKQLLRMGPRNARIVQQRLRDIALALGVPADHVPAAR